MKRRVVFIVIVISLILAVSIHTQQNDFPVLKGPYLGQKPPGMTPEIFAPGIVSSSGATEYGIAFAPDGKEFYFSWSQAFNSGLLNTEESDWCATVSPDGKYLFFTRNGTGNGDIYWVDAKIIEALRPKE